MNSVRRTDDVYVWSREMPTANWAVSSQSARGGLRFLSVPQRTSAGLPGPCPSAVVHVTSQSDQNEPAPLALLFYL